VHLVVREGVERIDQNCAHAWLLQFSLTQEIVDPADRFIRWRAPKVANIASVSVGDTVTEGVCIEEFRAAVERFRVAEGLSKDEIGKLFSRTEKSVGVPQTA